MLIVIFLSVTVAIFLTFLQIELKVESKLRERTLKIYGCSFIALRDILRNVFGNLTGRL